MERPTIFAGCNFLVGLPRLSQGEFGCERDNAAQLVIEHFQSLQIKPRELL